MSNEINILDLFSGIGGFSQGLKQAGFKINNHFYAEVDKHAQAIYKKQFPTAKPTGDVRHVRGSELGRINAITFGSPCQDFSMAGKRRGMDGERSSLITEAIRLITECRPEFFIWENVKGTFSSNNGADFWAIIQAFANIGGYRLEWQLLNTAWFLPQNRERIYLVGRITDKCAGQIFPLKKNDKGVDQKRKQFQSKIRANKNRANCLTSRMHKMGRTDNYIQDGAIRGRNPENPKSRVAGLPTQQMFEENEKPIASTLTTVQKDTVLKIKSATSCGYETAQSGDSINYTFPESKTRRGRVGKGKAQTLDCASSQATIQDERIRRLTEIECERLQGFESKKIVLEFDLCIDHQKNFVNAESKNHKLRKHALNAGKSKKKEFAKYANLSSHTKDQQKNKHAQNHVLINLERKEVQIHNLKKYHSRVNGAEKLSGFLHQVKADDFALLIAHINSIVERETQDGKVESHLNELHLTHPKNLKKQESKYGKEMMQHAKDAVIDSIILNQPLKCITSNHLSISSIEQSLAILSSFATHVITGFIPTKTQKKSTYRVKFISSIGWTRYGNYDGKVKEVSASQRYKCLGNAVTVDVVQAVGERILQGFK